MTAATELTRIERSITVRAPRSRVWRALSTAAEFAKWFSVEIREGEVFQPGRRIELTSRHEKADGIEFSMVIETVDPEKLISWRWHPGMPDSSVDYDREPMTLVEFKLEDIPGGTKVTVIETGFDKLSLNRRASVFKDNNEGWEIQMGALARHLESASA